MLRLNFPFGDLRIISVREDPYDEPEIDEAKTIDEVAGFAIFNQGDGDYIGYIEVVRRARQEPAFALFEGGSTTATKMRPSLWALLANITLEEPTATEQRHVLDVQNAVLQ